MTDDSRKRPSRQRAAASADTGEADLFSATIQTPRLLLRPATLDDATALHRQLANWNVVRWLARPPWPLLPSHVETFLADDARRASAGESLMRLIVLDGAIIGCAAIERRDSGWHLGYWLGEQHWGHGLMREAAGALIRRFLALGLADDIESGYFEGNLASWAIQRRLGFEAVTSGDALCVPQGRLVRHIDTRLTRARFEATRQ
jgi:RimJ/RimL family protein N-acetyltransferase